jgi:hypothetical protein
MNVSDIEVGDTFPLEVAGVSLFFLTVFTIAVFGVSAMSRLGSGKRMPSWWTPTALTLVIGAFAGSAFFFFQCFAANNVANDNFARELKATYGASSSKDYSSLKSSRTLDSSEAWLTHDGQETLVRFVMRDGKITPYTVLSGEYHRSSESS